MITSRAYAGEADLERLIDFLVAARTRNPIQRWHVGDLVWRMFYSSHFDPAQNVRLWQDDAGEVVGFGWMYPPNGADLHPRDPALLPEMIAWAEVKAGEDALYLATLDSNTDEIPYLSGFERETPYGLHLRRTLDDSIPASILPDGFMLRALAGDDEIEARALVHQQAFGTQNVTVDGYRNVTRALLYQRDLDLVVVAPDGRFAAFCPCWLDEINRVGLFEPVGTHPDFRRMGLAQAVMLEEMRRLQAQGMRTAILSSAADNNASCALYASLGFAVESHEVVYRRR